MVKLQNTVARDFMIHPARPCTSECEIHVRVRIVRGAEHGSMAHTCAYYRSHCCEPAFKPLAVAGHTESGPLTASHCGVHAVVALQRANAKYHVYWSVLFFRATSTSNHFMTDARWSNGFSCQTEHRETGVQQIRNVSHPCRFSCRET